jgi:hypothetical protein
MMRVILLPLILLLLMPTFLMASFRVAPYIQNPRPDGMTMIWFSEAPTTGTLELRIEGELVGRWEAPPEPIPALDYHPLELQLLADDRPTTPPFRHHLRLEGLEAGRLYNYEVLQGDSSAGGTFRTPADGLAPVRFVVYADSETEPESTGMPVSWAWSGRPNGISQYVVDQTRGYRENLKLMRDWGPDFVAIAGDLVESGGEQRDWDEFWWHNLGEFGIAGSVPLLPALGNHEYFAGPGAFGGYTQPHSERAVAKYLAYFELPENGAPRPEQRQRYYRVDYGAVTLLVLDVCNGSPHGTNRDTNHMLLGENDEGGGHAPDFNPGSRQYQWLEEQLQDASRRSPFIFVMFHHVPYSSGVHGVSSDRQSGVPVRVLNDLFGRYNVAAVFAGHDEMYESSGVPAIRPLPTGGQTVYTLHYYDVGIGGDGLRGPSSSISNPWRRFLAHTNAPEQWSADGTELLSGGKHYGHLRVEVVPSPTKPGFWEATLTPVHAFPRFRFAAGVVTVDGFEERPYNDIVILERPDPSFARPPQRWSVH